jgi:hypothetical protein
MKKTLLCLTLLSSGFYFGQTPITLTTSDIPIVGTRILNVNDLDLIGINVGSAGANQTYNLSGLVSSTLDSTNYISTSSTIHASNFLESNLTMLNLPDTNYTFLKTTSSSVELVGMLMASPLGSGPALNLVADNPIQQMIFPATYETAFTDVGTLNSNVIPFYLELSADPLTYVDSFKVNSTVDISSNIDGWGTLMTPLGSFNVLRQKVVNINTLSVQGYTVVEIFPGVPFGTWAPFLDSITTTITYTYLTNTTAGTPFILAEITTDENDVVTAANYSMIYNPAGIIETNNNIISEMYPNPSTDVVNIKANDKIETLNVYSEDGKLIYNRNINSENYSLNISSFNTGIYFVEISTSKGREVKRINKI